MPDTSKLKKAKANAKADISAAYKEGFKLEKVADQFIATSSKLAATTSEVLTGVLGGAILTGIGLAIPSSVIALSGYVISCIGLTGVACGIAIARGSIGYRGDRGRRELRQNATVYVELFDKFVKVGLTKSQARQNVEELMKVQKMLPPSPDPDGGGAKLLE